MAINEGSVRRIFSHLESGSGDRFFEHVAGDVDWTVEATHPLAGRYLSKDDFHTHTFARLNRSFPVALSFMSRVSSPMVIGAVVELRSYAVAKSGIRFDNRYCW
jgi:uncharacterized protein